MLAPPLGRSRCVYAVGAWQRGDAAVCIPARGGRIEPIHEWRQLVFRVQSARQRTDELIRPVVHFVHSPAERANDVASAVVHHASPDQGWRGQVAGVSVARHPWPTGRHARSRTLSRPRRRPTNEPTWRIARSAPPT